MPSTTLGGKWEGIPKTKVLGGEQYHVYAKEGTRSHHPIAYDGKRNAERAADKLRANDWNVRVFEIPSWAGRYVLYIRRP
jgi:hypothetical protein